MKFFQFWGVKQRLNVFFFFFFMVGVGSLSTNGDFKLFDCWAYYFGPFGDYLI